MMNLKQTANKLKKSVYLRTRSSQELQKELMKKIVVMFTDMQESTAFYKTHGDLAGRILMQKHNDMLFPLIKKYNGNIVKTIGDSIMAFFSSPNNALNAAVSIQRRLHAYNTSRSTKDRILVRIVMNYGDGIMEEDDIFGDVVNTAGKLLSIAKAKHILVSESFYNEVKDIPGTIFHQYPLKEKREHLDDIKIYEVTWESTNPSTSNVFLLSLKTDAIDEKDKTNHIIETMLPLVSKRANKLIKADNTELFAAFYDATACIETSKEIIKTASHPENNLHIRQKVGLHSITTMDRESEDIEKFYHYATLAREKAAPNQIVITSCFYETLEPELQQSCKPIKTCIDNNYQLYALDFEKNGTSESLPAFLVPYTEVTSSAKECFYCGAKQHSASRCPSKFIQYPTYCIEKIGYLSFKKIQEIFRKNFFHIVSPLKNDGDDKRFEIFLNPKAEDDYALGILAFYEITEPFQLRWMSQLWQTDNNENDWKKIKKAPHPIKKGGRLWMGEDCIRVLRYKEAQKWLVEALKLMQNDYRPHVGLAMLSMEKGELLEAASYLRNALFFPMSKLQTCHIYLLLARVYESMHALEEAKAEVEKIFGILAQWPEARYYYAILLAKTKDMNLAVATLQKLLKHEPLYCLKISLDPQMHLLIKEIYPLITNIWKQARDKGITSLEHAQKTLQNYAHWFNQDDEGYKVAKRIYNKAKSLAEGESLLGFLDLPGMEVDIHFHITTAITRRQKKLKGKIFNFIQLRDNYTKCLDMFPYRRFLKKGDFRLESEMSNLIERIQRLIAAKNAVSLREAERLTEKLQQTSEKVKSNQERLSILKSFFFFSECVLKTGGVFFSTGFVSAVILIMVLSSYHWYETASVSISSKQLSSFLKFGILLGSFSGFIASVIWIIKVLNKVYHKVRA